MSEADFEAFERINLVYKTVDGVPFEASVLAPKNALSRSETSRPVLVHFHGGGFILGTALDPQTLPRWMLQLAAARGAVVVSPCYRLIPEAAGAHIIQDVGDFWAWTSRQLNADISERWQGLSVDLRRIAVAGQDSGGSLAMHSVLRWPELGIRLVMAQHCAIDPESAAFNPTPRQVPTHLDQYVTEYLSRIRPGTFRVSSPYPERMELFHAAFRTGRWRSLLNHDDSLLIRERLRDAQEVPPVWIVQGIDDRIVPSESANELVSEIRTTHPDTPLLYSVVPGGHCFDLHQGINEPWVMEGLQFGGKYW